jgi:hypothetical protein
MCLTSCIPPGQCGHVGALGSVRPAGNSTKELTQRSRDSLCCTCGAVCLRKRTSDPRVNESPPWRRILSSTWVRTAERAKLRTGAGFSTWRAPVSLTRIYRASLALNQDVPAWCSLHRVFDCVSLCQWMIRTGMALAPDIGLLLTCEIDKYIDPVASERVHELDGVLHYRNPMPMCSARNGGEAELGPRLLATSVGRRSPAGISGCAWRCRPRR